MIDVTWESLPLILLTIAVGVFGVGRITRIVVHDDFPPTKWLREHVEIWIGPAWGKLLNCPWCFSVWAAAGCIVWWIIGLQVEWIGWAWWVIWGLLALAYVATMIYVRDEPDEE